MRYVITGAVAVILIAGCGGSSDAAVVDKVRAQVGTCLASLGVSIDGATVFPQMDGSNDVIVSDGATFNVTKDGRVLDKNEQADRDMFSPNGNC